MPIELLAVTVSVLLVALTWGLVKLADGLQVRK